MADGEHSIDDEQADLEARFRELEAEEQIGRLRRQPGANEGAAAGHGDRAADPLSEMKARFDGGGAAASFLLVVCPHCQAKNRTSLARLREAEPICGACSRSLASSG